MQLQSQNSRGGLSQNWMLWLTLAWLLLSAFSIVFRLPAIQWFALGDTDDNMRMMQVRALLNGQDWFDLRNYRMNPPEGANIHWSHLVDLPLAAIILITKPFVGGMMAEKIAIAVAPLIPLLVAFLGIGATVRRLVHPHAWILAIILFVPQGMMGMFLPTRIDHHGWQLALLAVNLAGLTDPKRARGGLTVGLATAASLAIGLEMLIFLAIAGAQIVLRWVWDEGDVRRMRAYGLSLAGGVSFFFLTFASEANWVARCDALTPVWLSVMIIAGAFVTVLSYLPLRTPAQRLGAAAVAGAVIVGGFALVWPQCLGRPEQVSPELERLWLKNITEARPIYQQQWVSFLPNIFLPLLGLAGTIWALMRARAGAQAGIWISLAFMSLLSCLMLVWQTRAGPAAQMVSLAGAVWLAWVVLGNIMASRFMLVRVFGSVAAFLLLSGIALQVAVVFGPTGDVTPFRKKVNRANARCGSLPLLAPIAKLPKATILTFVDLGPRLITVTHHDAISGPYHRNEEAILDLHKAWRGTPDDALAMARKHKATLLLICPDSAESTVYVAESPKGFYKQLADGKVPAWLEPVALPKSSPFRLWQIKPAAP